MLSLKVRWTVAILSLALAVLWIAPNFVQFDQDSFLSKYKLNMGLDIQGGLHLVMGVDVDSFVQERTVRLGRNLESDFKENQIPFQSVVPTGATKSELEIKVSSPGEADAVEKFLNERWASMLQVLNKGADHVAVRYFDAVLIEMKKQVVSQALEVIRNRIDEFGMTEPSITAQGEDRILVQLPGMDNAAKAKDLINRTARLDFRVVNTEKTEADLDTMIAEAEKTGNYKLGGEGGLGYQDYIKRLNEDVATKLPANTKIVFEKLDNAVNLEAGRRPVLVSLDSRLGGDQLEDASVRNDEMGRPFVAFRFNVEGRRLFAELTGKAVGGYISILLDDVVKSVASVRQVIDSDSAVIEGLGGGRDFESAFNEATFIATALRAGALPVALEQLEERTVGPSLGADSIRKGQLATLIGGVLVFLFMLLYYRAAGVIANITLILNILFTYAILSAMGATLTLPGVAGIALTIGMAVDANVLIYERIKEELGKGASQAAAVRDGFSNALSAIMDSNITTILTCLILMYYGTGPIRGFAVSLTIGLLVSLYTAVFLTRLILETLVVKMGLNVVKVKAA